MKRLPYGISDYKLLKNNNYYYIDKNNTELKEQMEECIKNGNTVMVYYDKYIGFKGISAPTSSPITKIEILEEKKTTRAEQQLP